MEEQFHVEESGQEPVGIPQPAGNAAYTACPDCESRIVVCRAICCRMTVDLSPQDLVPGGACGTPDRPDRLARGLDGYCLHLDRATRRCQIYQVRPRACRDYDCRRDSRIWADFYFGNLNPGVLRLLR